MAGGRMLQLRLWDSVPCAAHHHFTETSRECLHHGQECITRCSLTPGRLGVVPVTLHPRGEPTLVARASSGLL